MSNVTRAHDGSHALYALAPQRAIAAHHRALLSPGMPDDALPEPEVAIVARRFLDAERAEVATQAARVPRDVDWVVQGKQELTIQIKELREDTRSTP